MKAQWPLRVAQSLCVTGLLLGTLFFAASLTPSLLPRPPLMQGLLSGFSFAAGYAIGVGIRWLWRHLELPPPAAQLQRAAVVVATTLCSATAVYFLWRAADWQNEIRALMELPPVEGTQPFQVAAIAAAVFAVLLLVARLFQWTYSFVAQRFRRVVPRRIATVLGLAIAVLLFWSITNGVLLRVGLRMADSSFQQLDAMEESDVEQPGDPLKTGSEASVISWENLGRRGRQYVSSGPDADEIAGFLRENGLEGEALEPIRVYVGLNSAETPLERARLALEELQRVDAFERETLVLVTPTGTGWIDPAGVDTLEYLHRGNVASVAVQYSYLASWLSLLAEPSYGVETARAVFTEVYGYWSSLPEDERPELYLHGLSLGALNSDLSADLYDVIGDPHQGAFWSGPPFASETWRAATSEREPDSPAWLPVFRDGSVIRFTNQDNALDIPGAEWGPLRIVYLQYASDPITFFEPQIAYRRPDWLSEERGPDVSPSLQWFPVVTFLQLLVDIPASSNAPAGYGHVYAAEHYIDGWLAVTEPDGWSEEGIEALKAHLGGRY